MTKKNSELFSSILYIIVGALLAIFQGGVIGWAIFIVGAIFLVSGILDLIKKNWTGGAISIVIGIAIILLGKLAADIVILVLGILIALKGVLALVDILKKNQKNVLEMLFPVLTIVIGVVLAVGNGVNLIILVVGIILAVDGVLGLIGTLKK